jgi:hypothetical protein
VTVRVPTHKDGSALFWEFATDSYDIAFGLFFEWTPTEESEVSVHISDSEDEDINEEEEGSATFWGILSQTHSVSLVPGLPDGLFSNQKSQFG